MNKRSDRIWQLISALSAVAAVVVMVMIFFVSERRTSRGLEATVISRSQMLNDDISTRGDDLKVLYKGKDIANVSIFHIRFRNSGEQPIRSADIEEPIAIEFKDTEEVISAEVVVASPADLKITPIAKGSSVEISKSLLNPDDQFVVEVRTVKSPNGSPDVTTVNGRIAGIKEIAFNPSLPTESRGSKFFSVGASVLAAIIAVSVNTIMLAFFRRKRGEQSNLKR